MKKKQYIYPLVEAMPIQASTFCADTTSIQLPGDMGAPGRRAIDLNGHRTPVF